MPFAIRAGFTAMSEVQNTNVIYHLRHYLSMFGARHVWRKVKSKNFEEFMSINRKIEKEVFRLNGRKTLCAHAYNPRDEFWQLYDQEHYDLLRDKYNANVIFEDLYDKVTVRQAYDAPLNQAFLRRLRTDMRKFLSPNIVEQKELFSKLFDK